MYQGQQTMLHTVKQEKNKERRKLTAQPYQTPLVMFYLKQQQVIRQSQI